MSDLDEDEIEALKLDWGDDDSDEELSFYSPIKDQVPQSREQDEEAQSRKQDQVAQSSSQIHQPKRALDIKAYGRKEAEKSDGTSYLPRDINPKARSEACGKKLVQKTNADETCVDFVRKNGVLVPMRRRDQFNQIPYDGFDVLKRDFEPKDVTDCSTDTDISEVQSETDEPMQTAESKSDFTGIPKKGVQMNDDEVLGYWLKASAGTESKKKEDRLPKISEAIFEDSNAGAGSFFGEHGSKRKMDDDGDWDLDSTLGSFWREPLEGNVNDNGGWEADWISDNGDADCDAFKEVKADKRAYQSQVEELVRIQQRHFAKMDGMPSDLFDTTNLKNLEEIEGLDTDSDSEGYFNQEEWNPVENSVDNPVENSVDNPVENSVDNPVENSVDNPVENSVDVDNPVDNSETENKEDEDLQDWLTDLRQCGEMLRANREFKPEIMAMSKELQTSDEIIPLSKNKNSNFWSGSKEGIDEPMQKFDEDIQMSDKEDALKYFYISSSDAVVIATLKEQQGKTEVKTDKKTRYAQIVTGLKGHGKSTYCDFIASYAGFLGKKILIVNLDATAELVKYEFIADIRDVIKAEDVKKVIQTQLPGRGAGFEHTLRYILENPEWLFEILGKNTDSDYILFDCPGEEKFYPRVKALNDFIALLASKDFRTCCVIVRDSRLALHGYDFTLSCLTPLSSYINLGIPHISVLMHIDTLTEIEKGILDLFMNASLSEVLHFENTWREVDDASERIYQLAVACGQAADVIEGYNSDCQEHYALDLREKRGYDNILSAVDRKLGRPGAAN